MPEDAATTDDLLSALRGTLVEMHSHRVETAGDPRLWNRLVDKAQALHLRLRETEEGRRGITLLIGDANPTVRQWAASYALAWDTPIARSELEREAAEPVGLGAVEAKYTLREFDAGRLNMNWVPKADRP